MFLMKVYGISLAVFGLVMVILEAVNPVKYYEVVNTLESFARSLF